jgi:hypothetical protein
MRKTVSFLLLAAVFVLGGCQAIFTFSPLSGLQRDPSSMPPGQRLEYAKQALASGDTTAMKKAYDAIKNDSSADAQYTAAQLGIELSGIPTALLDAVSNSGNLTNDLNTINNFIAAHNLDPNYMVAAAVQLAAAKAAGAVLTTMDYAMEAMGQVLSFTGGTWNIPGVPGGTGVTVANGDFHNAVTNVVSLPAGDPLKVFINDLDFYLRHSMP